MICARPWRGFSSNQTGEETGRAFPVAHGAPEGVEFCPFAAITPCRNDHPSLFLLVVHHDLSGWPGKGAFARRWTWRWGTDSPASGPLLMTRR